MSRLTGLRYFVIATAVLHIQASNAAVIRDLEATTVSLETTPRVSTTAGSTIPQDIIAQTTLPPILFRTTTLTDTPTDSTDTYTTDPEDPTTPDVRPELPGELLSRGELQLGRQSTLDTSTVGGDSTLVPTTQLVPVHRAVPAVGQSALDHLVKIATTEKANIPKRVQQTGSVKIETVTVSKSTVKTVAKEGKIPEAVSIPKKAQDTLPGPVSMPKKVQGTLVDLLPIPKSGQETLPGPESIPRKVQDAGSAPLWITEMATSDSLIPPTMQIMAYVMDALWEKEHKNLDDGYKVTEDVNDTKDDWEDDDMSKPRFQTNVPIVNSESVPMRMHMDIIPQGFPEDLEGSILYPDYYDDKDTKNDLGKFTDLEERSGDAGDDVGAHMDRFSSLQQQMRFFRFSDTFDKLVDLYKDLAVYAKNHDIKMHEGFSDRVTDVLRKNTESAASQLRTVIAIISDEIDDESLDNNLKHFREDLAQPNSESSLVLSSLPALYYS